MSTVTPADGVGAFSERVLRYFLEFLQTDFKKVSAPRRRIQIKTETGYRTGVPLRKYPTLYVEAWRFAQRAPAEALTLRIGLGKHTAPMSATIRDLIRQHVEAIDPGKARAVAVDTVGYARRNLTKGVENPEKFAEDVQDAFVELVGQKLVHPLLALLEGAFERQAYSTVESIYEVESDLTVAVAAGVVEQLPTATNTLVVSGDTEALARVFAELFSIEAIRHHVLEFFDGFATSDAFQEVRDLAHTLRASDQQALYLYLSDLRFGKDLYPLFYIPAILEFDDSRREYVLAFDPHLYVNKMAVDWITQERQGPAATVRVSPVQERVVYVNENDHFIIPMKTILDRLVPAFEIANALDLTKGQLQQVSAPDLKISTNAYLAVFDRSDESLVNDYEELLAAFGTEQHAARQMFESIVRGFLEEDPVSVATDVEGAWSRLSSVERLVTTAPIAVNEEQRKILEALKHPQCRYIAVQGPPGTGKSHTISAIAFDCILAGQNVLVLSDKQEALDVVGNKLEDALQRVRHGDDDFPNPILRLGKSGSGGGASYQRLLTGSVKQKIKTHHLAASQHAHAIEREATQVRTELSEALARTMHLYSEVKLADIDAFHKLEARLAAERPGFPEALRAASRAHDSTSLAERAEGLLSSAVLAQAARRLSAHRKFDALSGAAQRLQAWKEAAKLTALHGRKAELAIFSELEDGHRPVLMQFIAEYDALRMPLFGYLFCGARVQALNSRVAERLPCPDPVDLHKRLHLVKGALSVHGLLCEALSAIGAAEAAPFAYRLLRDGEAATKSIDELADVVAALTALCPDESAWRLRYGQDGFADVKALLAFVIDGVRYLALWARVGQRLEAVPAIDFAGTQDRLQQLDTARMTRAIDARFIEFVEQKAATAKAIGGVIKAKTKFPAEEFAHLAAAFPCIIAGIRDYAEYVPLKQGIIDVLIIDEASQVSVAQALPALLRAKKVIVFGDKKQFSNIKSAQASIAANLAHLTDIEALFRARVSQAATKLERLKHFDVKRSILDFFDLVANYQTMLVKHFRGYQELISFSSVSFYDGALQAIKIRSQPVKDILRFVELPDVIGSKGDNTNAAEVDFILAELKRLLSLFEPPTVGVITPFREQAKLLLETLFQDADGERFERDLRLKVMTFDTCQGEERDLIVYSMVATPEYDALNYIFPVTLERIADKIEEQLKAQRLNVGFSRAKEGMLFVLSKPLSDFRGSIGRALAHFHNLLQERLPSAEETDPKSPMERRVLEWLNVTPFFQANRERLEVEAQFPIGQYLKQLDPFYEHPAYRVDFLLRYRTDDTDLKLVIEYDGFAEHFMSHRSVHHGNWDSCYKPEDLERQYVLESYGYKFLRINRFNMGKDPVETLSRRLYDMVKTAREVGTAPESVARVKADAASLGDGTKKTCSRCGEVRPLRAFFDRKLKGGAGGHGRVCLACKNGLHAEAY